MSDSLQSRILIIEDEKSLLEAMQEALTREGYIVSIAHDGEEGLKLAVDQKPNLIILDILMPKMDGMTLLKKLRAEGEYGQNVKVIVLTNLEANDNVLMDVVKTQPTFYLVKSDMNIDGVAEKVKEVLKNDSPKKDNPS